MTDAGDTFMLRLFAAHPYLSPVIQEHLEDNFGELLSHLLLADVQRWADANFEHNRLEVLDLLAWLEAECLTQDSDIEGLLAVSFLQLLPRGDSVESVRSSLGPCLLRLDDLIGQRRQ